MLLSRRLPALLVLLSLAGGASAQRELAGSAETRQALERLNVLGSVLMIGAHPDDENTALLAYFARGRDLRTAYLSLTRGEGGQNLIGAEQGAMLGLIRTQELLAARRIDGAEQYFTRAIDFGFSKSAEEAMAKWGRDLVLADVVWNIRRFQPDVILASYSGTPRDGHGHHQAAGILAREAFAAAADPKRFPEQLKYVSPWKAKRILQNLWRQAPAGGLRVDPGEYDPLLGHSYGEIAGMSRSMHRSQGMGAAERRGAAPSGFLFVAGDPASEDPLEGIDVSWNRLPGGAPVGEILARALRDFDPLHPDRSIPLLVEARPLLKAIAHPWAERKMRELDETIALCAGLWLDASADRAAAVPGSAVAVRVAAMNRSRFPIALTGVQLAHDGRPGDAAVPSSNGEAAAELAYNVPFERTLKWQTPAGAGYSQPYWLVLPPRETVYTVPDPLLIGLPENPPVLNAVFRLAVGGQEIVLERPVRYRYVDRVEGEQTRPFEIVPAVAMQLSDSVLVFPDGQTRNLEVKLTSNAGAVSGALRLEAPAGWRVSPERPFAISATGEQQALTFQAAAPAGAARPAALRVVARVGGRDIGVGMVRISYPHIPPQVVFPELEARLTPVRLTLPAKRIGYVMGAGDEVPGALRQMGADVTLLSAADLATGDLLRFDAIVTGVRAYNVRSDLRANQHRLLNYVERGGTLVVQYNVADASLRPEAFSKLGPYPLQLGRGRVTVEEAPVSFPTPESPLLKTPNRIGPADFEGWVQERGLYFASEWDPRYKPLFETGDPGEPAQKGGTLYTRYGKGVYVFTAMSWFRQLPAGVPGAFRIFANLLGAGKAAE